MNKKTLDIIVYSLYTFAVVFMITVIYLIVHYSEELKANPLLYGLKKMGSNVECSCIIYDADGIWSNTFKVNTTEITYIPKTQNFIKLE